MEPLVIKASIYEVVVWGIGEPAGMDFSRPRPAGVEMHRAVIWEGAAPRARAARRVIEMCSLQTACCPPGSRGRRRRPLVGTLVGTLGAEGAKRNPAENAK